MVSMTTPSRRSAPSATTGGGDILLGVNDHGRVVGMPRKLVDAVTACIRKRCAYPDVFSSIATVSVTTVDVYHRKVVLVHVEPSCHKVRYKGGAYVRQGECDYRALD